MFWLCLTITFKTKNIRFTLVAFDSIHLPLHVDIKNMYLSLKNNLFFSKKNLNYRASRLFFVGEIFERHPCPWVGIPGSAGFQPAKTPTVASVLFSPKAPRPFVLTVLSGNMGLCRLLLRRYSCSPPYFQRRDQWPGLVGLVAFCPLFT